MPGRTNTAVNAPTVYSVRQEVENAVPKILDQAQISTVNHQKNVVALYKIHVDAALFTEPSKKGKTQKVTGEKIFWECVLRLFTLVLRQKKGVAPADRVVKFLGAYVKFVNEKGRFFIHVTSLMPY
jgi:condensin complex subunit 3